nr:Interferon- developmental regulator 2 [Polyrhizophydium stewartii]
METQSNVAPMEKIKIKHETVECDSWSKIRQLNAFRDIVGEGLSVHFRENPLLQHVFHLSFDGPAPGKITSTERRLYQTIVGKARTKALKQMRGTRAAVKSSGEG